MHISNSPEAIGRRLRLLRDDIARLTIAEFAKLAGVSSPSVSYWENGQIDSPIKPKSMAKVVEGFKKVGIEVNERWLKNGEGSAPTYKGIAIQFEESEKPSSINIITLPTIENDTQLATILSDEIKLFASLSQAVITKIDHNRLAPYLEKGDLVGGLWQNATTFVGEKICILQQNNQLHISGIKKSSQEGLFDLFYPGSNDESSKSSQKNIPLEKIAPIIRVWR